VSTLRPYQQAGVDFLVHTRRAILADEPGLGKTAQALVAANRLGIDRMLVVAPKTAAGVWADERDTWDPYGPEIVIYQGARRHKQSSLRDSRIFVTNYSLLRETLSGTYWPLIVWDEAHKLKDRHAKTLFRVVKTYVSARNHFFLTGSPIRHSAGDLWPLLNIINPGQWGSYWDFVQEFCSVWHDEFGWHVEGVHNDEALRAKLQSIMLRRRKEDELPGLPPKQRQFIPLEMARAQQQAYTQLAQEWVTETTTGLLAVPTKLALLTRLRQLLVHPALIGIDAPSAAFDALRDQAVTNGEPIVVYTPFPSVFPLLVDMFDKMHWKHWVVKGGMSPQQMSANVRSFQLAQEPERALFVSLGSAISFTANAASTSYHLGFDWSPDVNVQAEDRLHRESAGRRKANFVLNRYFVHPKTVDSHLRKVLERKTSWARLILDPEQLLRPAWKDT